MVLNPPSGKSAPSKVRRQRQVPQGRIARSAGLGAASGVPVELGSLMYGFGYVALATNFESGAAGRFASSVLRGLGGRVAGQCGDLALVHDFVARALVVGEHFERLGLAFHDGRQRLVHVGSEPLFALDTPA